MNLTFAKINIACNRPGTVLTTGSRIKLHFFNATLLDNAVPVGYNTTKIK